jgi:hypothetical protein
VIGFGAILAAVIGFGAILATAIGFGAILAPSGQEVNRDSHYNRRLRFSLAPRP